MPRGQLARYSPREEGEEATDGIEVARGAGHTEVALQSIVGETGVLIALGGSICRHSAR